MRKLILASSSKYRRALLKRLNVPFECISPQIDETPKEHETPHQLVKRLSLAKANVIAATNSDAIVIGSDQIAIFENRIIGKPGSFDGAFNQLKQFSGNPLKFITGVAIVCAKEGLEKYEYSEVTVKFRALSDKEIKAYLIADQPYDCAGSFKVESLGISLFEFIQSDDPTSLEGLPLIIVSRLIPAYITP